MEACVTSMLLHNCEAFGSCIPNQLESLYYTLIKAALNVRKNTANDLVLVESGLLDIKGVIQARQHKFYDTYITNLKPNSARHSVFTSLRSHGTKFLQHYSNIFHSYPSPKDVKSYYRQQTKEKITKFSNSGKHYKYGLYMLFNPELKPGDHKKVYSYLFSRLRLSSHSMPIKLGRWN